MRYLGYGQNSSYSPKKKKKSPTNLTALILFIIGTTSYWERIFNKKYHRFKLDNTVVTYLGLAIKLRTRGNDYTDTSTQFWFQTKCFSSLNTQMPKGWEFYVSGQGQDSVQFDILHLALWVWVNNAPVLRRQNPNHTVFMFGQQPSFYKLIISPSHLFPMPT